VPVVVMGTLDHATDALEAPLTRRRCAAYEVVVTEGDDPGDRAILHETMGADFILRDGTGKAVRLGGAIGSRILIRQDVHRRSGSVRQPNDAMAAILARNARFGRFLPLRPELTFIEGALGRGDQVAVAGIGHWEADANPGPEAGGYRDSPRVFVIEPGPKFQLIVLDDPELLRGVGRS
jgi:hypothetical protein